MKLIAFGHRKRVGKDTAAKFLACDLRLRHDGISVVRVGFADKVKDVAYQVYAWAGLMPGWYYEEPANEHLREVPLPPLGKTPRQLWIGVGNGIRAATGYDGTWLDYLLNVTRGDVVIVKDLRFPAEADGILDRGGWVYRVDDPRKPKVMDGADDPLEDYDRWTGVVDNSGTINALHAQVMAISARHFP